MAVFTILGTWRGTPASLLGGLSCEKIWERMEPMLDTRSRAQQVSLHTPRTGFAFSTHRATHARQRRDTLDNSDSSSALSVPMRLSARGPTFLPRAAVLPYMASLKSREPRAPFTASRALVAWNQTPTACGNAASKRPSHPLLLSLPERLPKAKMRAPHHLVARLRNQLQRCAVR